MAQPPDKIGALDAAIGAHVQLHIVLQPDGLETILHRTGAGDEEKRCRRQARFVFQHENNPFFPVSVAEIQKSIASVAANQPQKA